MFFSIQLSLVAATVATGLALVIAVPAAYALSRYRFRGREAVDAILEFPIIVSPAALGAIILIFFSNPLGEWMQEHSVQFVFAFAGIVLAQFITILGVAVALHEDGLRPGARVATKRWPAPWAPLPPEPSSLSACRWRVGVCSPRGCWPGPRPRASSAPPSWSRARWPCAPRRCRWPSIMRLSSADIEGTVALILVLVAIGLTVLYGAKFLFRERRART